MLLRRKCALRLENEWVAECTLSCVQLKYYVNTERRRQQRFLHSTRLGLSLNWNIFPQNLFGAIHFLEFLDARAGKPVHLSYASKLRSD